jgi:hypothetical protein
MIVEMNNYRSEAIFDDADASAYGDDMEMQDSTAFDEVMRHCGLSSDMLDDLRDMKIY